LSIHTQQPQTNKPYDSFDYEFSPYEQILWKKAKEMVDKRLHGNYWRGAIFEAFIFLVFEHVVDILGLKNKIRILHNPFSYRRYISREGLGIDILVQYKRWTTDT